MPDQTEQDFRDIERDRDIDTESGEPSDDWADPELWNDEPRPGRVVKEHVQGHRFRACVQSPPNGLIVFRAYRQNWTKASRQECYEWAETHGYDVERVPQDD